MSGLLSNQLYVFLMYCLSGLIIGILFDIFRIFRKSFKTPDIVTYIEDVIFWILTVLFLIFIIFKFNNGEIRSYIFIGLALGILMYLLMFSKIFIKVNIVIIERLKKIVRIIFSVIEYPVKIIARFFDKIVINNIKKFNNILIVYVKKCKNNNKFTKKQTKKEGF